MKFTTKTLAAVAVSTVALAGCASETPASPAASSAAGSSAAGSIMASGSSAQKNAMTEWVNAYQTANAGITINYQPSGSGAGVTDFINGQTLFAGSDSALKDTEVADAATRCGGNPAINIPMVGGAIALAYNLDGVDNLILTPKVAAGIFTGAITKWDDAAIAEINPGVTLPAETIAQFHRSDESGTTDNFTKWLNATASDVYTFDPGKAWVAEGGQGAKGSDGVAAAIKDTPNSIGYIELSFVMSQGLKAAAIDNGGGAVAATSENAAATIAGASIVGTGNDLSLKLDRAIADGKAYPIVLVTYEITCEKGLTADEVALVKPFLAYTASDAGQGLLSGIGYVPITGDLLTKVRASVDAIS